MSDREKFSSTRYFWASLRPLGRPLFWLPLGILSFSLLAYWQYQQNPNWIETLREQPRISIEDEDTPPAARNDETAPADSPAPIAAPPATDDSAPSAEATENTAPGDPLSTITGNSGTTGGKKRNSSLFLPLLPTVKQNSTPSSVKPLAPIQVAPASGNNDYPLQGAIDNLNRSPRATDNPPTANPNIYSPNQAPTGGNSYQAPVPTTNAPYGYNPNPAPAVNPGYQAPTYGTQPGAPTGYPNQVPQAGYNNPGNYNPGNYQAPQTPTRNYTIQRPIDARSSGY
jgi:hypothetical protein